MRHRRNTDLERRHGLLSLCKRRNHRHEPKVSAAQGTRRTRAAGYSADHRWPSGIPADSRILDAASGFPGPFARHSAGAQVAPTHGRFLGQKAKRKTETGRINPLQFAYIHSKPPVVAGQAPAAGTFKQPLLQGIDGAVRPRGGVVTQRTANPCTPVQFRARPPKNSTIKSKT
jgi:hypothetical protein